MGTRLQYITPLLAAGAAAVAIAAAPTAFATDQQSCNGSGSGTVCLSPGNVPIKASPPDVQHLPSGDMPNLTVKDFALALGLVTGTGVPLVDLIKNRRWRTGSGGYAHAQGSQGGWRSPTRPDPWAEITRRLAGPSRLTGTPIDTLGFQVHRADRFHVQPPTGAPRGSGNTAPPRCFWFSATVAGPPTRDLLDDRREPIEEIRREVEPDMRFPNIATIAGTGAVADGNAAVERG